MSRSFCTGKYNACRCFMNSRSACTPFSAAPIQFGPSARSGGNSASLNCSMASVFLPSITMARLEIPAVRFATRFSSMTLGLFSGSSESNPVRNSRLRAKKYAGTLINRAPTKNSQGVWTCKATSLEIALPNQVVLGVEVDDGVTFFFESFGARLDVGAHRLDLTELTRPSLSGRGRWSTGSRVPERPRHNPDCPRVTID